MRTRWNWTPALAAVLVVSVSATAEADWPQQRHDGARTGLAEGASDITVPAAYFRYYLGGSLREPGLLTYDVDADGTDDLIYVSGGGVIAKKSDDTLLWKTRPMGFTSFVGLADLDGDFEQEVVVYANGRAMALSASTGTIQWAEPVGEMGTVGAIAVGDLDGDGLPDVLIQECGCCGVNSGNTGYAYSFGHGFALPQLLFELPAAVCGGYDSLTLVDADGVAPLEVLNATQADFSLLDGLTGAVLATTPNLGTWTSRHHCRAHDIDGVPGDELLCLLNRSNAPATDQRKITVLGYDPAGPSLAVRWSQIVAPDDGGDITWVDPFVDVDADGDLEIVIGTLAGGTWTTRVFDAATGAELATIAAQQLVGVAPVLPDGKSLILTTTGTDLVAHTFDGRLTTPISEAWTLTDRAVMVEPQWAYRAVSQLGRHLVTVDLTGDGIDELITRSRSAAPALLAYDASGGTATLVANHTLTGDADILGTWVVPGIDVPNPQVAMMRNDGHLALLDQQLQATNSVAERAGIRVGGYYAAGAWRDLQRTPVAASLDGATPQSVLVTDSRKATLRLDAASASLANPPTVTWRKPHLIAPAIVPNLDNGGPGVAAFGLVEPVTDPPDYRVLGLSAGGQLLFDVPLEGQPYNDLLAANLDHDGTADLVFQWGHATDTAQQTRGISGADGSTLWNAAPIDTGNGPRPAGIAVSDFDGDGRSDVYLHGTSALEVASGADGSNIATSLDTGWSYFMPTVYDIDGSAPAEVTLHGSKAPLRALSADLQTELWQCTDDDSPYPYGAVAPCAAGPVLVTGSWEYPARLKLTQMAGPSAGSSVTSVLAGGQKFPSESAAIASGEYLGQLSAATVHSDLTGQSRPTALVGSSDGWLYAVDPCSDALDFALDFGTAVGEAVFGDTDGDGRDEILVTAADGYLYGLKHLAIEPPLGVVDTDPSSDITGIDVDEIVTSDSLHGAWVDVPGAVSYEVSITVHGGGIISSPAWQDVGLVTAASVEGLPLVDGSTYHFAVRAIAPTGDPSTDVLSDGVTVTLDSSTGGSGSGGGGGGATACPGAGPCTTVVDGCGCRLARRTGRDGLAAAWLWCLLSATLARRRRRRPAR